MRQAAETLAEFHGLSDGLVRRAGHAYPVVVERVVQADPEAALVMFDEPWEADEALAAAGEEHLSSVAARSPNLHDGPVVVMSRIEGGVLHAGRATYFSMLRTCDALRAELESSTLGSGPPEAMPMRALADRLAAGRVAHDGSGRAAAVGVSVVVTEPLSRGRGFVYGRRRAELAADPCKWHVAPSGMLEPGPRDRVLRETVRRELTEELGIELAADAQLTVMGFAHDLLRLKPEICLRLDLDAPADRPAETAEFDRFELVSLEEMGELWERRPPQTLTPAAAGAIALLEGY